MHARKHVVRVLADAGDEHHDTVRQDEQHEPDERNEVDRAGDLPVEDRTEQAEPVRDRRALQQPGCDGNRRGDKDRNEIAKLLQPVVPRPAIINRKVQRGILYSRRERVRKYVPGDGHEA